MKTITSFLQCPLIGVVFGSILFLAPKSWGQPTPIATKPTEADVRRFLEEKIKNESDGRISLAHFNVKEGPVLEQGGIVSCSVYFSAAVHFRQPCIWDIRANGSPLSFRTVAPSKTDPSVKMDMQEVLEVSRRGQGYIFSGDIIFNRTDSGWSPRDVKVRFYPKQKERQDFAMTSCASNLKEIAVALLVWARAHENSYAFNISTNAGGTRELCDIGSDGFDQHPENHLRAMAGPQLDPRILVCPADSKMQAANIRSLHTTNVTYLFRPGTSVALSNPKEVLCQCPIHGTAVCCDGSIKYQKPAGNN